MSVIFTKSYNWKRCWVPREGALSFDSDGFLMPTTGDDSWAKWRKNDAKPFEELITTPCLVLLGELGIGKSVALDEALILTKQVRPHATCLGLNLGAYGDEQRLIKDVFHSPEFQAWSSNGGEFHLFLDSFDECLLRLDTVAIVLEDQMRRIKTVDGLFLRIASRTAEWRTSLEEAIKGKWGDDKTTIVELAPLTRNEVQTAAKANAIDSEKFVRAVIEHEVVAFAIKPLTLKLLLKVWKAQGESLPTKQADIYEKGCLELCSESNPDRDTPKLRGELTPDQRLAVAGHVAAATVFCKRSAIWKGLKPSEKIETDLSLAELTYGSVAVAGQELTITLKAIRETLDTGLFNGRGPDRLGWAHQSYAEYLAARYAREQKLSLKQMYDLLQHPHDDSRRLIPQLHEVAAWIAPTAQKIFTHILNVEPDVLLRSDIATADAASKAVLVEAIISRADNPDFTYDWWGLRKRYRKLKHPGIEEQLRKALSDQNISVEGRVEAVHMVEACEVEQLLPLLVDLAVDPQGNHRLREAAAGVVSIHGDALLKARLKPLALGECGPDRDNDLRGIGLMACWPGVVSAEELFAHLRPHYGIISYYSRFLSQRLVKGLSVGDLPTALRWAEARPEGHGVGYDEFRELVFQILQRAALHLSQDNVLNAFAKALLARLRKLDFAMGHERQGLVEIFNTNSGLRLKVAEAMLPYFEDSQLDAARISRWGFLLIQPQDLDWLLGHLLAEKSPSIRRNLSALVFCVFFPDDAARIDSVITAAGTCSELAEALAPWLKAMDLDSEEAKRNRAIYQEQLRLTNIETERKAKTLSPLPSEHIRDLLTRFEVGDMDAWSHLCLWAEVEDDGQKVDEYDHIDLEQLPGWKKATDETKARILSAAKRYASTCDASPESWFTKVNFAHYPSIAGIRALLLLAKEKPDDFVVLGKDVWLRWIAAILRRPDFHDGEEYRLLVERAFAIIPNEATDWTLKCIKQENREGEYLFVLNKLPRPFSSHLGAALLDRLKRGKLKTKCALVLLQILVEQRVDGAIAYARRLLPRKPTAQESQRLKALSAAGLLLTHGESGNWPRIHGLIRADSQFGRDLFEHNWNAYHHKVAEMVRILSADEIGSLWEWMLLQYPFSGDPPERRAGGMVTTRWAMADIRDSLIAHLADLGTAHSCKDLLRLTKSYPKFSFLSQYLSRSRDQMRRNTWCPPKPQELFQLSENTRGRFVQSADQLLDVVCDSLTELQDNLHGETPAAPFLWDNDRPKVEEQLSDWVKIELENVLTRQGVILGREVQIHIKQRTDIHVDAIRHDPRNGEMEQLKVILEVKGCWHPELKTAMETQLAKRYLTDNDCLHGIYLVFWFICAFWSKRDRRLEQVEFETRHRLEQFLQNQAHAQSCAGTQIRSVVLDASQPWVKPREKRKRAKHSD